MDRRQFLAAASGSALGLTLGSSAARGAAPQPGGQAFGLDSPPVLQNPTPDGVTITWAITGVGTGWVEYGPTRELGQRALPDGHGLVGMGERFLSVRLVNLKPGEPIFYKVVSLPVTFHSAYSIERGQAVSSEIFKYRPPSLSTESGTFAVINDTHEKDDVLRGLMMLLAADPGNVLVYNGDVFNDVRGDDQVVNYTLRPAGVGYAVERPVLFIPGNHDHRGAGARGLGRAFTHWPQEPGLPRNFTTRVGPIAILGLDTGEDKPDRHPAWAGLAAFEPYRIAQRDWLAGAIRRPEIASAPFLVVFCHIPLWGEPGANGGDTLDNSFGSYCKQAQNLWHPLLVHAGAHVVISGHTHSHRYDAPGANRPYGQLVGGGPSVGGATLIRGKAADGRLEITAQAIGGRELGRWTFTNRRA